MHNDNPIEEIKRFISHPINKYYKVWDETGKKLTSRKQVNDRLLSGIKVYKQEKNWR